MPDLHAQDFALVGLTFSRMIQFLSDLALIPSVQKTRDQVVLGMGVSLDLS